MIQHMLSKHRRIMRPDVRVRLLLLVEAAGRNYSPGPLEQDGAVEG